MTMIEYDSTEFFCALYVLPERVWATHEMAALIASEIGGVCKGSTAFDEFCHLSINHDKSGRFDRANTDFTLWPYRVECFPIRNEIDPEKEIFKKMIFHLINRLRRNSGFFVVVSCRFEDEVMVETGWNWTAESQFHPHL